MTRSAAPVTVLVVDDSSFFRRFLTRTLGADPGIEVIGEAASAEEAYDFVMVRRPDVITLDLEMPGLGGMEFLRQTTARLRIPTIVVSSTTQLGARRSIEALEAGAVDVMPKPQGVAPGMMDTIALATIAARVRAVAQVDMQRMQTSVAVAAPVSSQVLATPVLSREWVIALGASTGGVQALGTVLQALPVDCPPVVIVQHMPAGFTEAFARRLNATCAIEVREARQGDRLSPGLALIAPGGERHMRLRRAAAGGLAVEVTAGNPVCYSTPSIDVLLTSAAKVAAPRLSAAVLTGMGSDGANGLLAARLAGAQTFVQDEATSLVYGMPARAWERGAALAQVPLDQMAEKLLASVGTTSATQRATAAPAPRLTHRGV
ncbi:chemotaxis-specific protein-glutamate methyltransferase CheB [uncultured Roseovarius sp.]|uniref:chemotaxis-specific protein-glutamate methyltransferase CheB n=1 Tax=uncultured Roseovarius sp. TaxID=293344 RepID=UPI000C573AFA|nr:chemotaxis response regulator protein-glutamate methylesterase [Roseovarius sp.]MBD13001.1 chemotaxis response regulator protein-glutamate methylesterase [Roseovarius sp.]